MSSSGLMVSRVSRAMELHLNINKSTSDICIVYQFFFLSIMQSVCQKDAPPHAFGGARTVECLHLLCMCPRKLTFLLPGDLFWYDSPHACIPAASKKAVHAHGNNEALLKNRPASFIFMSFCLLGDLLGVASTNVCPAAVQAVHPFPSRLVFFSETVPCSFLLWLR